MKDYFLNESGSLMYGSHEARANIFDWLYRERKERASINRKEWIEMFAHNILAMMIVIPLALANDGLISWGWFAFSVLLSLFLIMILAIADIIGRDGR